MRIKTIERSLSREYSIYGLKEWRGARMVAEIDETENEYECGKELERKVESQLEEEAIKFKSSYVIGEGSNIHANISIPTLDYKAKENIEDEMERATTIEQLAKCKEAAAQFGLSKQYMEKIKQLTAQPH